MIEQDQLQQQQLNEKIKQKNIIREIFNLNYNKNKKSRIIQQCKNILIPLSRQNSPQSSIQDQQDLDHLPSTILTNSLYNPYYHNIENNQIQLQNSQSQIINNSIVLNQNPQTSIDNIQIDKFPLEKFIEEGDSIDVGLQEILLSDNQEQKSQICEGYITQKLDNNNFEKSFNRLNLESQQQKGKRITLVDKCSSQTNQKTKFIEDLRDVKLQLVLESAFKHQKNERSLSNNMTTKSKWKQSKNYYSKETNSPKNTCDKCHQYFRNIPTSACNNQINQNNFEQMLSLKETFTKSNKDSNITDILNNVISKEKNAKCRQHPLVAKIRSNTKIYHQNIKYDNQISDLNNLPLQQNQLSDQIDIEQNENSNLTHSISSTNRKCTSMPRLIQINKSQRKSSQDEFFEIFSPKKCHKKAIHSKQIKRDEFLQSQKPTIYQDNSSVKQKRSNVLPIASYLIQQYNKKQEQQMQKINEQNNEQQQDQEIQEFNLKRENSINQRDSSKILQGNCNQNSQKSILYDLGKLNVNQFSIQNQINEQFNKFKIQSFSNTKVTEISNISTLTQKQQVNINSQKIMNQINIFSNNQNIESQLYLDQMTRSSRFLSNQQTNSIKMQSPLEKVLFSVPLQQQEPDNIYSNYYSNFSMRLNEILQSDSSQCPSFLQQNKPSNPPQQVHQSGKENLMASFNQQNQNINLHNNLKLNKIIQPQNYHESKSPLIRSNSNKNTINNEKTSSNSKLPQVGRIEGSLSQHTLQSEDTSKLNLNYLKRGLSSMHVSDNQDKSPISSMSNLQAYHQNINNSRVSINRTKSIQENTQNDKSSFKNETINYFKKLLNIKNSATIKDIDNLSPDSRKNRINKDNQITSILQLEEQNTSYMDSKNCQKSSIPTSNIIKKQNFSVVVQQSEKEEKQKIQQYASKISEVIQKQKKNYQHSINKMFA